GRLETFAAFLSAPSNTRDNRLYLRVDLEADGGGIIAQAGDEMSDRGQHHRVQCLVARAGRPRRHAGGLDAAVQRLVVSAEMFEMRQVPGAPEVEYRHDKATASAPDPAGSLDVLGRRLGLTVDYHQT